MIPDTSNSKLLSVVIVYISFLLDNILLTVVVPIIPDYLFSTTIPINISEVNNSSVGLKSLSELQLKYENLENEYGPIGVLLSSKALIQLIANPIVGYITKFVGYNIPLVIGCANLLVASFLFAYGQSYRSLLVARSLHGIASACVAVSGMSLVAARFHDSTARSQIMGFVMGSVALGVLFGYPLGGVLYGFLGKTAPFIVIAVLISACLDISYPDPSPSAISPKIAHGWRELLLDPSVSVISGAVWLSTTAMAVLEPCLPLWMMTHIHPAPEKWQLGTVFIPDSLGYLLGTNCTGFIAGGIKKWKLSFVAMIMVGICAILVPSASTVKQLILPHLGLGLGIGVLDAALVPILANLVDRKHGSHYGVVYALQQVAVSMAYSLGPLFGGETIRIIGFPWLMRIIGMLNLLYCPFLLILARNEAQELPLLTVNSNTINYNTDNQLKIIQSSNYERFYDEEE